jgi:hypothetical protein
MALAVLLIIGLLVVVCLVAIMLGLVILGSGDNQGSNVFSARQDWMNSHTEESE